MSMTQAATASADHHEEADKTSTVCVVGAGSSGLTVAKNLREHGVAVEVVEREDDVGGNWYIDAANSRVYESVRLISSKPFTQFPDFPMPDHFPDYPHHTQIHAYLRRYADHFGLRELIAFHTAVEWIEPVDGGATWKVTTVGPDGERRTARYGGVVIANGHNWNPKIPDYPGEFAGTAIHAADYREPSVLAGQRVLVVGAGNTGCDLAVESAQHAAATLHSTRRGYWYSPKYTFGRPSDQVYDLMLGLRLPKRVLQALAQTTLRLTVGDLTRHGLRQPDHRFLETHPIVNSLLPYYVGHGAIRPKPDITRLDGDAVVFADGSREPVDVIVWCTGYLVRFPFIDHAHLNWADDKPELYLNVFPPGADNLAVCGLIQPDSGQFKIVHWQAVAIAKVLRAHLDGEREALARFRQARADGLGEHTDGGVRYKESTRHYYEINHFDYLRGVERLINHVDGPGHTKVVEPVEWSLPPAGAAGRELRTRLPEADASAEADTGSDAGADAGKPPLLFVHGVGHGAWCFDQYWMPAAAAQGWPCYAVSLRGHGASAGAEQLRRATLRDYVHDVLQAITELPAPPVLVGHSMGALVVQRVLERYTAAPAAVLVAPAGGRHGLGIVARLARRRPWQLARTTVGGTLWFDGRALVSAEVPDEVAEAYAARQSAESPLAQYQVVLPRRRRTAACPVLVLGGGADEIVPPIDVDRTAQRFGTRAVMFPGLGHDLMLEARWHQPLQAMLDWLAERTDAARAPRP